jgi:micrococcal nuclease
VAAGALAALVAASSACSTGGEGSACGPTTAVVARVVDGDTIELASGEKVRYLLVDTPESVNGATDCFGHEAATFNQDLLEGKTVTLAYDDAQCRDRFDRLLAYVSVDGREANTLLVERGYACVLYIPPAGTDRHEEFEALEAAAKADNRGMWGTCTVVTCE